MCTNSTLRSCTKHVKMYGHVHSMKHCLKLLGQDFLLGSHGQSSCSSQELVMHTLEYFLFLKCVSFSPCSPEYNTLTFDFHIFVASHLISSISLGHPSPEAILSFARSSTASNSDSRPKKQVIETSIGDCRLWIEVLRNLSKDLSKNSSIVLTESSVAGLTKKQRTQSVSEVDGQTDQNVIVTFTCGHSFPLMRFQTKIVTEFVERVKDFPLSTPLTLKHLQLHYKQSAHMSSSCPYCVFQYLRKIQLKECPDVPIKPWNPA